MKGEHRVSGYDNNYSEIFDGDGHGEQTGGGLRKQLEEALGEIRSLRNALNQEKRQDTVSGLLKEKGIDPAAAGMIPEGSDPQEWIEQNARFLKAAEIPMDKKTEQAEPEVEVAPDPELEAERQQLEGLQEAGETGIPSTATSDQLQKIQSFDNEADLLSYIQSGGAVG